MTASSPSGRARNSRALRLAIAPLVTLLVVAGVVGVVLHVPHHQRYAAAIPTPSAGTVASSPTPESSSEPSRPSAVAQGATSATDRPSASTADSEAAFTRDVTA